MKVISINVNGIRSAAKKGLFEWLRKVNADIICLQELRAQHDDLIDNATFQLAGYTTHFHCAEKKGYSGVGIYSKIKPDSIKTGLGWDIADKEGRYIEFNFGRLRIASLYLPSGTSGPERQNIKFDFLKKYTKCLLELQQQKIEAIVCGDWNIAHQPIDLKNWKANQKNSGFLPEERAWMDQLLNELNYIDAFREINKEAEQYTWWSNRGRAYEKNVGWRIDYQIVTPGLRNKIKSVAIFKDQRFSDHAPLIIDYHEDILLHK